MHYYINIITAVRDMLLPKPPMPLVLDQPISSSS